eukprot:3875635-Amphidinium_carterae.1
MQFGGTSALAPSARPIVPTITFADQLVLDEFRVVRFKLDWHVPPVPRTVRNVRARQQRANGSSSLGPPADVGTEIGGAPVDLAHDVLVMETLVARAVDRLRSCPGRVASLPVTLLSLGPGKTLTQRYTLI